MFNTYVGQIEFEIDKGVYKLEDVQAKIGEYIEYKFTAGMKLSNIVFYIKQHYILLTSVPKFFIILL